MRLAVLLVMLAVTGAAHAHPILIDPDRYPPPPPPALVERTPPPPPPPARPWHSRIGLRVGAGKFPLDHQRIIGVGLIQLSADIELMARTRTFGEYAFLLLEKEPNDPMARSFSSFDHRLDLGVAVEVLGMTRNEARLTTMVEAGGGIDLITGELGPRSLAHAFVGVRGGMEIHPDHDAPHPPPSFGFELVCRALIVPDGAGLMVGLGMLWGG